MRGKGRGRGGEGRRGERRGGKGGDEREGREEGGKAKVIEHIHKGDVYAF